MPKYRPTWKSEEIKDNDLTIILLTLNKTPKHWQEFYKEKLLEAIGDRPLIIVSKEKIDWNRPNTQYLYQDEPDIDPKKRINNIYFQLKKALELVNTNYVATVDDDCLYSKEHFDSFRPPLDKFAYNYSRWCINLWLKNKFYYYSPNPDNPILIVSTKKFLNGLKDINDINHETTKFMFDFIIFYTEEPIICIHHTNGLLGNDVKKWKKPWPIKALSLPKWGDINEIIKEWR